MVLWEIVGAAVMISNEGGSAMAVMAVMAVMARCTTIMIIQKQDA